MKKSRELENHAKYELCSILRKRHNGNLPDVNLRKKHILRHQDVTSELQMTNALLHHM